MDMHRSSLAGQYWHFFKWLFMPNRFNYWLLIVCLVFAVVAGASSAFGIVWPSGIFAIVFTLWFLSGLFSLSGQLIALGSSRQFGLLSLIRTKMLIVYWSANAALIIVVAAIIHAVQQNRWFAVAMSCSICIFFNVFFSWSNIAPKMLAPVLLFLLVISAKPVFLMANAYPLLSCLFTALLALGFSYWWLQWRPAKRVNNLFLISSLGKAGLDTSSYQNPFIVSSSRFLPAKTNSLHGVLLKAGPDAIRHRLLMWGVMIGGVVLYGVIAIMVQGVSPVSELLMVTVPMVFLKRHG